MTTSIEQHLHDIEPAPEGSPFRPSRNRLVAATWAVFGCGITGGIALIAVDITSRDNIRYAIYGILLVAMASLAAGVLAVERMLAEREQFYRRGHLVGWMRGWRGQEPLNDDPLLH
ncbi:hypothetical protein [Krasilnikovia sp. MM14-A1259]|uniref:hypothetical protein n=1 Tax=Krasilnikovia sp. MM14-A1259 TaxID=3373539 RepID=UPI00380BDB35